MAKAIAAPVRVSRSMAFCLNDAKSYASGKSGWLIGDIPIKKERFGALFLCMIRTT